MATTLNPNDAVAVAANNATIAAASAAKLNGTTPSTTGATAASKADIARTGIAGDLDQFMLLLTTQLKNQDPTEPLDTNAMTAQLVSFAGVEQQINTNKNLEQMISLAQASKVQNGVSYIGKGVDADGNSGFLSNKQAAFVYELPAGVNTAAVSILDTTGSVVFTGTGSTQSGKNIVSWDGKANIGNKAGTQLADGRYTIAVNAKDATGKAITAGVKTYTTGLVSAASYDKDGNLNLEVGTLDIPIDKVIAVREAS